MNAIEHFVHTQTQGLPGKVSFSITPLDPRAQLSPCSAFEPFLPGGSRLWGKSTIGVRCLGPSIWTIYVPVQVNVRGSYLLTARALPVGHVVGAGDVVIREGDLGSLPANIVTDERVAIGKTVKNGVAAGQLLRSDFLTAPWVIKQGQSVTLVSRGNGFSASSEGKSLNNAVEGQVVQARTGNGQVVSGIARAGGVVDISY